MAVKQTIPSNSNTPKSLAFSKFRGVDLSSSPFEVSPSRATHSLNMISENGVNHKRKGRTVVHNGDFGSYIQLIKLKDSSGLNTYMLQVSGTTLSVSPRDSGATSASATITACDNRWCNTYEQNGCAYFLSKGNFKKIYVDNGQVYITDAVDSAYVPTTTISINSEYDVNYNNATSQKYDDPNLLIRKRKNSLRGHTKEIECCYYYSKGGTKQVKIRIYFTSAGSSNYMEYECDSNGYAYFTVPYEGKYTITSYLSSDDANPNSSTYYILEGLYGLKTSINGVTYYKSYSSTSGGSESYGLYQKSMHSPDPAGATAVITTIACEIRDDFRQYKLDTMPKPNTQISITIKSKFSNLFADSQSFYVWTGNYGYIPQSDTYYFVSGAEGDVQEYTFTANINSSGVATIQDENSHTVAKLNGDIIKFLVNTKPYSDGEDNIIIEYTDNVSDTSTLITSNKYNMSWALDGNSDRLFVYGNEDSPALLYFSGFRNFEYFPLNNSVLVGNTSNPISGISVLSDSTIAVHKGKKYKEANIFYLTPTTLTLNDNNIVTLKTESGTFGETPLNPNCCLLFGDDHLIISENGVFAITPGANIKIGERYAYERSSLIHDAFVSGLKVASGDLEYLTGEIACTVYDNKLYIASEGKMYIADARYKTSPRDQDMNDTYNYEWWVWDNMPQHIRRFATYSYSIENTESRDTLRFWNDDGTVGNFNYDGYRDEEWYNFAASKWAASDNNLIILDESVSALVKDDSHILANLNEYEVEKVTGGIKLKDESGNYVNPDTNNLCSNSFCLKNYKNVVSEWYTPILSMGTPLYSKNLLSTTLTFEPDTEGTIKFGYLTRRNAAKGMPYKQSDTLSVNGVDFTNIDFTDFSFATNFAGARTLKTRVRNFNYIQFRIKSEDDKDCALNNFVVTYNIGRKNKGVR